MTLQQDLDLMGKASYSTDIDNYVIGQGSDAIKLPNSIYLNRFKYTLDETKQEYLDFIKTHPDKPQPKEIMVVVIPYVPNITEKKMIFYFNDNVQVTTNYSLNNYISDIYIPLKDPNETTSMSDIVDAIKTKLTTSIDNINKKITLADNLATATKSDITDLKTKIFDLKKKGEQTIDVKSNSIFDFISETQIEGIMNIPIKYIYQTFNDNHRDLIMVGEDMQLSNLYQFENGLFQKYGDKNSIATVNLSDGTKIINNLDVDKNIVADECIDIKIHDDGHISFIRTMILDNGDLSIINEDLVMTEYYIAVAMMDKF